MVNTSVVVFALLVSTLSAQTKPVTVDDFAGTWNIEVMSHQVALVIERQDASKVTATMMMMGRDVPLTGELVDRTITFVGVKSEAEGGHVNVAANAKPIVVTMQDDGTLAGEMMTNNGPVKWTAERLKTRKKPQP